jgi:3-ketosteroid 9alpha-monooxygenase subunit B
VSASNALENASSDPRHQFHPITIYDVVRETADAHSFIFEIPSELAALFQYKSGQFFTFEIPWEGFQIKRCYSLSSATCWGEKPKVTVKRIDDGRMSNWMNENLKPGDRIRVMPPAGSFVLHDRSGPRRPLTLFGGGSGITPVISLLKQALLETERPIKMIYANRDLDSIIFRAELEAIADQFGSRLQVVHHLDSEAGFLTASSIAQHIEGRNDSDFYICGPTPFMETIEGVLKETPLAGGEIHVERFISAVDPDREHESVEEPESSGTPDKVTVLLGGASHKIEYREGETILQAAIRAGLDVPYSCQDGYCSCCMAKLREGEVYMASREALTDAEISDGWVLTCQAKPTTQACEVEYED